MASAMQSATPDAGPEHSTVTQLQTANDIADEKAAETVDRLGLSRLDQMMSGMINEIVGGIFAIALGLVLLNQLFQVDVVDTANGSFSGTFDTVQSVGGAALTFAVLGMLALAGGTAVRMFRT